MNTEYMNEFLVLAESRNFQKAAEYLNISQSSLSKHIKNMEQELGVSLLDRTTRTVNLNECGILFYNCAKQIIQLWEKDKRALKEIKDKNANSLNIGFSAFQGWQYGTAELMISFMRVYPMATVSMLHIKSNERLNDYLREGKCDFIFSPYVVSDSRIERQLFVSADLAVAVPWDHPLAGKGRISFVDLKDEKFIVHDDSSCASLREKCRDFGFEPDVVMTIESRTNMLKMVDNGLGIALIYRQQIPNTSFWPGIKLLDIDPPDSLPVYCQYSNEHKLSPLANEFLQFITCKWENT